MLARTLSTSEQFEYAYDAVGNRKTLTATTNYASRITHYDHDAANRLTNVDGVSYTYDDNGNLLSDGARTFVYDTANRLTQVVSGTFTTEYTYSGDGVRLAQDVNGVATRYVNDVVAPLPQVLQEQRSGTQVAYLYGLGQVGQYDSGTWSYQHPDGLGSVRHQSDGDGRVQMVRSYTPFGAPLSQLGTPQGSFGFAGEQTDAAAGLTFLRARYYDPATGRFLTRDPYPAYASVPSTLHRYAYVGNNPVNLVDPSGLRQQPTAKNYVPGGSGPRVTSTSWPRGPSYDMTGAAANRARAIERINRITQAQSRGHRQPYCGPTGGIGNFFEWTQSPAAGIATIFVSGAIVAGSTVFVVCTYGPEALIPLALGAGTGAVSEVIGQWLQDRASGNPPNPGLYIQRALVGAVSGWSTSAIGLAGATLGLPPAVTGAISGFAAGALSRGLTNWFEGEPIHAGVVQQALVGATGGAFAGFVVGKVAPRLPQTGFSGLVARMGLGGGTGGLVSGGTHAAMNLAAGRDPREGLEQAFALGFTTGAVDAAMDFGADRLVEQHQVRQVRRSVMDLLAGESVQARLDTVSLGTGRRQVTVEEAADMATQQFAEQTRAFHVWDKGKGTRSEARAWKRRLYPKNSYRLAG